MLRNVNEVFDKIKRENGCFTPDKKMEDRIKIGKGETTSLVKPCIVFEYCPSSWKTEDVFKACYDELAERGPGKSPPDIVDL